MATLNTLNGRVVRLYVTPRRSRSTRGLAEAAAEQLGLTNVTVTVDGIVANIGNGMTVELDPIGIGHAKIWNWLRDYRIRPRSRRGNAAYLVRTYR